jgi:hypothetical protein
MLGVGFGPTLARIEENHLLDVIQFGSQALHRDVDPGFFHSAVRSGPQKHGYRTIETVDVELLIGPMIPGPPTADVAIFHVLKDIFNVALTSIGSNNLFIMPCGSVGKNNMLAQIGIGQLIDNILSNSIVSLRDILIILLYRICHHTLHIRPTEHRFALLGDRGDCGACSSLEESLGSVLQCLRQLMQCSDRLRKVIVQRKILRLKEIGMIGDHHGSCLAGDILGDTATLCLFYSESVTRSPGAILIGDFRQCFDFTHLDRPDIVQLEGVNEAKMVLGILPFIKEQCQLWNLSRGAKSVRQQCLKVLDHHWQLLGVMAIALIDLIIQGHLRVGLTKQRRAHWAYIRATLCVFAAFGDVAAAMKRIKKGIQVGPVRAHRSQVNGFTRHHVGEKVFPDGAGQGRVEATHVVPKALRRQ